MIRSHPREFDKEYDVVWFMFGGSLSVLWDEQNPWVKFGALTWVVRVKF